MSENTSCNRLALEVLERCLAGVAPARAAIHELVDRDCSGALFRIVVEGLADRFEPRLCDAYAAIFAGVIARILPQFDALDLRARYERVRQVRECRVNPQRVYILSRVTLGADIAVTSVLLDAAKKRFPQAEIFLASGAKAAELFAADPRIQHTPVPYPRGGSLAQRLGSWSTLRLDDPGSIVIDPDSRLTQLGLLPVCAEENYFFFESRSFGGDGDENLTAITQRWSQQTFGVPGSAYLAPLPQTPRRYRAAISLGVGENQAKRIADPFEEDLLRYLGALGGPIVIDRGAGGEEAARVEEAVRRASVEAEMWNGSFAGFASLIAQSDLYVGYDSAGQHAAAALGVPLVTVFAGFVSERMFQRWQPSGKGPIRVVRAAAADETLRQTIAAVRTL